MFLEHLYAISIEKSYAQQLAQQCAEQFKKSNSYDDFYFMFTLIASDLLNIIYMKPKCFYSEGRDAAEAIVCLLKIMKQPVIQALKTVQGKYPDQASSFKQVIGHINAPEVLKCPDVVWNDDECRQQSSYAGLIDRLMNLDNFTSYQDNEKAEFLELLQFYSCSMVKTIVSNALGRI